MTPLSACKFMALDLVSLHGVTLWCHSIYSSPAKIQSGVPCLFGSATASVLGNIRWYNCSVDPRLKQPKPAQLRRGVNWGNTVSYRRRKRRRKILETDRASGILPKACVIQRAWLPYKAESAPRLCDWKMAIIVLLLDRFMSYINAATQIVVA